MSDLRVDLFDYSLKPTTVQPVKFREAVKPFEDFLSESIVEVNKLQKDSDKLIERLATGDVDDISEVVMASSRAEVAMRMMMEVRNKLLEAYQQISRIQG